MSDSLKRQVGGDHYQTMKIQPWEIFDAHPNLTFYECCAIKYILRRKPGEARIKDLQKAIHCLEHQSELEQEED